MPSEFERLLGRARELLILGEPDRASYLLGEAMALWRGPALDELEDWDPGKVEASRLDELRLDAEELTLEAALRAGRHRQVLGTARTQVEQAPLRERRWALLALAQYQSGRQAEALRTLREVRTVLSAELGLDPGPDLVALEDAIRRQDPSLVADAALPQPRPTCPYRGLVPYDVADAEDFYGRDHDVAACRDRLTAVGAVTVVGPSGSGKSSLVRAGLAAGLARDGHRVVVITPGPHPLEALTALPRTGPPPVLVVDQCEEVIGLCNDPTERTGFLAALTNHAERAPLIVAVRADRLGDLSGHVGFTRLVERSLYLLNPMTTADLVEAIEGPARGAGLRLETGLVDLLVREVEGEPGALPLLSHALRSTWDGREGNTLTVAGYRQTGGVRGAVAQSAETVYEAVPPDQRPALRDLLLRMVAPNPEGDPMRSRLPRRLVAGTPHHEELIETLVAARLVTSDDGVIELAHEALVRAWPRLHDWLDDDAEGQRILRHLVVAADTWNSMGRPDSELYRGTRLAKALEWHDQTRPDLTPTEQEFLDFSHRLADAEAQTAVEQARQAKRINRRLRGLLTGVAILTVGAIIAALIALQRGQEADQLRQEAVRQRNEAAALALAVASRSVANTNPGLAVALAAESSKVTPTPLLQATGALAQARLAFDQSPVQLVREPILARTGVYSVAFSANGELLATADADGKVGLWDPATGDPASNWPAGHTATVTAVAFSPDGDSLASAGADGTVRLWDPPSGDPVGKPIRHADSVRIGGIQLPKGTWWPRPETTARCGCGTRPPATPSVRHSEGIPPRSSAVTFSPTGDLLASAGYDGTVRLWNPTSGDPVGKPIRHAFPVESLAFSPKGHLLASAGFDGTVRLWDPDTGDPVGAPLRGHSSAVRSVGFSPDGDLLASAGLDGTVRLWDPATGTPVGEPLRGHTSEVLSVTFSPNGDLLASAGLDGTVRLWEPRSADVRSQLDGHIGPVYSVALSPRGDLLASAGDDGTVRLWNPDTGHPVGAPLRGHTSEVLAVTFSPTEDLLASAGRDGTIRLWDPDTGTPAGAPLRGHTSEVLAVTFSPTEDLLASAGRDGTIRLWDPDTGTPAGAPLRGHGSVHTLAFSPEGDRLAASTGLKGSLRLWDPATRDPIGEPFGEYASDPTIDLAPSSAASRAASPDTGPLSLTFSHDADLLASAGRDGTVRLWDPVPVSKSVPHSAVIHPRCAP